MLRNVKKQWLEKKIVDLIAKEPNDLRNIFCEKHNQDISHLYLKLLET
jgi:hypothetical protein